MSAPLRFKTAASCELAIGCPSGPDRIFAALRRSGLARHFLFPSPGGQRTSTGCNLSRKLRNIAQFFDRITERYQLLSLLG